MKSKILFFCLGMTVSGTLGAWIIREDEKRMKANYKKAKLAHSMLMDLVERADPEVLEEINAKYEFDAIVLDI